MTITVKFEVPNLLADHIPGLKISADNPVLVDSDKALKLLQDAIKLRLEQHRRDVDALETI